MSRSWFPYLTVLLLLALLAVLATLQYRWLGQISDAESTRLTKRLSDDTNRFARDFDQEIQKAFFNFQVSASELRNGDLRGIQKRFAYWQRQSPDPGLIKTIYFVPGDRTGGLSIIDLKEGKLVETAWPGEFARVKKKIESSGNFIEAIGNALVMPLFGKGEEFQKIVVRRKTSEGEDEVVQEQNIGGAPKRDGYLIVELDREIIKNRLLPRLAGKYFSRDSAGSYELSVTDEKGGEVFSTSDKGFEKGDTSVRFFGLRPNEFTFMSDNAGELFRDSVPTKKSTVVMNSTLTEQTINVSNGKTVNVDMAGPEESLPRISLFERESGDGGGQWRLSVRHSDGSLEKFITNTRNRNLAISFGILSVLAAGMVLIVVFAVRTRALAKRQLEFVSSVSHEFRTPLAVIYSAGENISDGVVEDTEKLYSYGELIKREGLKLSAMVEQVLEYAGANSGGRTYEFKSDQIDSVIESALEECLPVIEEKGFEIERDIDTDLPPVMIDRRALVQAMQNLVANGLKYSNGSRWIKISAFKHGSEIRISVEDRGIGIAPGDIKNVFEPFYRAKNVVDEQISGNGLGLSLVKEIVNAHKGQVSVKSETGKGSVFTISIPIES